MTDYSYVGGELSLFEKAHNWKSYFGSLIRPYLRGEVLEVGAGIGANTKVFSDAKFDRWVCLEPDERLAARLEASLAPSPNREIVTGYLADVGARCFDAILYIDVLEHIAQDGQEMRLASEHLKPGGHLIVLSPAHSWLYTPFDEAIGHHRRYTKASLSAVAPAGVTTEKLIYLDSVGLLASLGNRLLLKSRMPTEAQIKTWDSWLVPCSRRVDRLLGYSIGKTIVGVWRRI